MRGVADFRGMPLYGSIRTSTQAAATAAVVLALALSACGGGAEDVAADPATAPITLQTFCVDYLAHPVAERPEAIGRLVAELGAPTDVDWYSMVEQRCAQAPDLKLGDFFNHFR